VQVFLTVQCAQTVCPIFVLDTDHQQIPDATGAVVSNGCFVPTEGRGTRVCFSNDASIIHLNSAAADLKVNVNSFLQTQSQVIYLALLAYSLFFIFKKAKVIQT